ncbi:uncharacterized protein LOC125042255 isoform X2 [Penaeus chinensis]|nr:uncharacterized protein LOC125042255 isoform X2 [Penaeus chinensis]
MEAMEGDNSDYENELGPVPVSELQKQLEVGKLIDRAFEHVKHSQAAEEVADIAAGAEGHHLFDGVAAVQGPIAPEIQAGNFRALHSSSGVGSDGTGSRSINLRYSGTASNDVQNLAGNVETVDDFLKAGPSLETLHKLNLTLQRRFEYKRDQLDRILQTNLTRQAQLRDEISQDRANTDQEKKGDTKEKAPFRVSNFCVPYFKNRSGMNAPKNEDARFKLDNGCLDLYTTRARQWKAREKEALKESVHKEWKQQLIDTKELKLRDLQRRLRNADTNSEETSLEEMKKDLEKQIRDLRVTPAESLTPPPLEKLDWEKIAAQTFDGHRTSDECSLQWENLLHPAINTSNWDPKEDMAIQELVTSSKHDIPDWSKIASKLKTNRTGYLVMQRWVSFIAPALNPAKWTPESTQKLIDTVNMLRVSNCIPWAQVHQHLVGFSRYQIQSRWRQINPEQSKGPFTVEEDFILIKGLHMFGLNFSNIAHFMPGRSYAQVRDRYKRTILPNLTYKPWTREEDEILIQECQVGARNWRKMILQLPMRNACQIRVRYHILQEWQTLTDSNLPPPPLFPVSTTTDAEMINKIRMNMIRDTNQVKELVDQSRAKTDMKDAVMVLENRRKEIKARKAGNSMQKLKCVTEKRGRRQGTPNPHQVTLENAFLTQFFLPWRCYPGSISISSEIVQSNLCLLGRVQQLKISSVVSPEERKMLSALQLSDIDTKVVDSLVIKPGEEEAADEFEAHGDACPETIPLIPPNQTTLGAFISLLLHRPQLEQMALGGMITSKFKKLRESGQSSQRGRKRKLLKNFRDLCPGTSRGLASDWSDIDSPDEVESSETRTAQQKVHITSVELNKTEPAAKVRRMCRKNVRRQIAENVATYSRGKIGGNPIPKSMSESAAEAAKASTVDTVVSKETEREEAAGRQHADELLFHRMLSLFYWPTLMSKCR